MLKTIILSFQVASTYKINSIIYSLKQFPLLKKIINNNAYQCTSLKIIAAILNVIIELGKKLFGKAIYLFMLVLLPSLIFENTSLSFINIFVFLTILGGITNDLMLEPTRDKYYSIILLKMDAKKYAISDYLYQLILNTITYIPFLYLFGILSQIPISIINQLLILYICVKMISIAYNLIIFEKTNKYKAQTIVSKLEIIPIILLLVCSYLLPALKLSINIPIFEIIFIIILFLSILSLYKIIKFKKYNILFKKILTIENIQALELEDDITLNKKNSIDSIEITENETSNKKGFAYFHELFVKRHSKILTKAVKMQCIFILIITALATILTLFIPDLKEGINRITLNYLPYFVFIMYILNRGVTLTQAMFMNCDHSMLTYRIYRTPKVILGIFKERLKTLIIYNGIPALLIGLSLPFLLFISGGTDNPINYIILFVSILSMSIFFSVHYLVLYYLLQPYNINTEVKSSTYSTAQGLTYVVCYFMIELKLPTFYFGISTIIFCIAYSIISLILAYNLAPKTFKLRN